MWAVDLIKVIIVLAKIQIGTIDVQVHTDTLSLLCRLCMISLPDAALAADWNLGVLYCSAL